MRTRHTMTLFLVLTLLTNLAHHERGSVTASGVVEKGQFTTKRRILDRLLRQGLASSDQQQVHFQSTSQQHLYPATPPEVSNAAVKALRRAQHYSLLKLIRSNTIPSNHNFEHEEEFLPVGLSNSSSVGREMSGYFFPDLRDSPKNLPTLMEQYEPSGDMEDSLLRRRHAAAAEGATEGLSAKERKQQRKLERQRRRQEKKDKRKTKKGRRRKQNKRLEELLENKDVILHNVDGEEFLDCCPSKVIVVEKQVGKDRKNHAVEVRPSQQYFYEQVCLQGIEEKECVFPARSLRKGVITRCVQQFSYVQAQVRPYRSMEDWQFDYIYVKSGCSCQVSVTPRKKKNKNKNK